MTPMQHEWQHNNHHRVSLFQYECDIEYIALFRPQLTEEDAAQLDDENEQESFDDNEDNVDDDDQNKIQLQ